MSITITNLTVRDVRFPTSRFLDGSDAVHTAPDYSAAYVILETNAPGLTGHGMTFTLGRGNEICCAAIESFQPFVIGLTLESIVADGRGFWRALANESQLRWIGPEKGAIHLAQAAIVNAVWDLMAKQAGKPVWQLLADMSPQQIVDLIDFRHITDELTEDDALAILRENESTKAQRIAELRNTGLPAYTTSAGWIGYSDDKMREQLAKYMSLGWTRFKMKVGVDIDEDVRRASIMRETLGNTPNTSFMVDANQVWEVDQAIANMKRLAPFEPLWIEEPTSPDDILGHAKIARAVTPIKVATGEHCQNRVMFKQFLAAGAMQICQIDSCRLGGVNEILAVLLLARKFNVPVCPHAGGVGLCNYVQHLAAFNYIAIAPTWENTVVEFSDHLHEHSVHPVRVANNAYVLPDDAGYSIEIKPDSLDRHTYPGGAEWQ